MENIVENVEHLDNFTQQEYPMSTVEVVITADATSTTHAVTTALALSCIIAVTVIGNVLVILSVFTYRPLRSVQNMLIVSLAVADITVALLVMPLNVTYTLMGKWKFGLTMCKFWLTCDVLCCTASILNLCVIALDRYWAIHDPINYAQKRTLRRVLVMIALVWIVSILVSAPPLIGWNDWPLELTENSSCQLTAEKGFVIYSSICAFFLPLLIMTTVYVRIFKTAKQRIRKRAGVYSCGGATKIPPIQVQVELNIVAEESTSSTTSTHNPPNEKNEGEKATQEDLHVFQRNARLTSTVRNFMKQKQKICLFKERRATRVLGIVMGVFVLCWLPFFLMYVIMPFCEDCYLSNGIVNFITWLGYVNSALNPVIYTVFNLDFRKALSRILCKKQ